MNQSERHDRVTKLYFGHPNRGYVIDKDGKIIAKQLRFDERKTVTALYETLSGNSAKTPQ